ncbi:peptidoglycan-binding domain-containing protein [Oceanobacillus sojae]|uniref:peptidoglycan-binding domain-containing protein n=1 Tax=Oceanobacillus sojae TaxID=582851 RepID=UPI00098852BF|nr:peptidoglycan-binding domain-containing protein [Oceanobacillus sojae]MCT1904694.1 peptidoglycan-binding protein [Oceanobacillus sojae]
MKKKWFAAASLIALSIAPLPFQSASASSGEAVQAEEHPDVSEELQPLLDIAPEHQPTLENTDSGLEVQLVQEKLNHFGLKVEADGIFGPKTEEQVRQFQADHDLIADGIVGEKTWTALLFEEREDQFTVDDAVSLAENKLDNEDLIFSSDGVLYEEDGKVFYILKASSQSLIDNGGTGTVGYYHVYSNGDVLESEPPK